MKTGLTLGIVFEEAEKSSAFSLNLMAAQLADIDATLVALFHTENKNPVDLGDCERVKRNAVYNSFILNYLFF